MAKTTKWFKANDEKPVHKGWYDVKWHGDSSAAGERLWWNGRQWKIRKKELTTFGCNPYYKNDSWRGLLQDPTSSQAAGQPDGEVG